MATSYCEVCGADLCCPDAFRHEDLRDCLKVKDAGLQRLEAENAELRAQVERGKAHAIERVELVNERNRLEAENRLLREQLRETTIRCDELEADNFELRTAMEERDR